MGGFFDTLKRLHEEWTYEGRQRKDEIKSKTVFGMHPATTPEGQRAQRKAIARLTGQTISSIEKKDDGTEMIQFKPFTLKPARRLHGIREHSGVGIPRVVDTIQQFFPQEGPAGPVFLEQEFMKGGLASWIR